MIKKKYYVNFDNNTHHEGSITYSQVQQRLNTFVASRLSSYRCHVVALYTTSHSPSIAYLPRSTSNLPAPSLLIKEAGAMFTTKTRTVHRMMTLLLPRDKNGGWTQFSIHAEPLKMKKRMPWNIMKSLHVQDGILGFPDFIANERK